MTSRLVALFAPILLAACDAGSGDAPTGGLTAGEAAQLEAAAERLDARSPSPAAAQADALAADVRAKIDEERNALERR